MKTKHRSLPLIGLVIVVSLMACGRRLQPPPVANPTNPGTNLTRTARAFTATPSQVPTVTLTPTPRISSAGTSLVKLADGSTEFTDYHAGIKVIFPATWLAMRVGEQEYYQAWDKETAKNPALLNVFMAMQNIDPDQFRVTAIDVHSETIAYQDFSNMEVVFAPDDTRSLNEVRVAQTDHHPPLSKYNLLSSRLEKTADGMDFAVIEFRWESATPDNEKFKSYHKSMIFKVPAGTVSLQLFTGFEHKDALVEELDQVFRTLVLFTP